MRDEDREQIEEFSRKAVQWAKNKTSPVSEFVERVNALEEWLLGETDRVMAKANQGQELREPVAEMLALVYAEYINRLAELDYEYVRGGWGSSIAGVREDRAERMQAAEYASSHGRQRDGW